MREWTETFDMSTIPDAVLKSEWGRRCAKKRHSYTGGLYWRKHNPEVSRCRCRKCMDRRAKEAAA